MAIRNTFARMIEARERQARRYVNGVLAGLDDATLERAGIDRKSLRRSDRTVYPF